MTACAALVLTLAIADRAGAQSPSDRNGEAPSGIDQAVALTAGTFINAGESLGPSLLHLSGSFETRWPASRVVALAEVGLLIGEDGQLGILTPAVLFHPLSAGGGAVFVRAGPVVFASSSGGTVGLHFGAGFNAAPVGDGVRFELRNYTGLTGGGLLLEALVTYQFGIGAREQE
ncbi:MAG: hypothetical protein ACR2GQ_05480 [Gemmatimonadota bacterium]